MTHIDIIRRVSLSTCLICPLWWLYMDLQGHYAQKTWFLTFNTTFHHHNFIEANFDVLQNYWALHEDVIKKKKRPKSPTRSRVTFVSNLSKTSKFRLGVRFSHFSISSNDPDMLIQRIPEPAKISDLLAFESSNSVENSSWPPHRTHPKYTYIYIYIARDVLDTNP